MWWENDDARSVKTVLKFGQKHTFWTKSVLGANKTLVFGQHIPWGMQVSFTRLSLYDRISYIRALHRDS